MLKWGGQIKQTDSESAHVTLWRNDAEVNVNERLSWNQVNEQAQGVHHTDQNTDRHSVKPNDWRRK